MVYLVFYREKQRIGVKGYADEYEARSIGKDWLARAAKKPTNQTYHCELWIPEFVAETYHKSYRQRTEHHKRLEEIIQITPTAPDWFYRIAVRFKEEELGRITPYQK